jgi:hypothetical protein
LRRRCSTRPRPTKWMAVRLDLSPSAFFVSASVGRSSEMADASSSESIGDEDRVVGAPGLIVEGFERIWLS